VGPREILVCGPDVMEETGKEIGFIGEVPVGGVEAVFFDG